jgi:AraC-like DNA-binding protein
MYKPVKDGIEKSAKFVSYIEEPAQDHLTELVHCYWELKTESPLPEDFRYHVLPDACVNILLNQIDRDVAAITAIHTTATVLNLGKSFHYIGVQLLPGVWRGSSAEIQRGYVDQPYAGDLSLVALNEKLSGLDFTEQQSLLSKFVEKLRDDELIAANETTAEILRNLDEIRSVADMAAITKLSSRQLQRVLKETTGFSPHDFLKVLRVQQSFRNDHLAYYADQSHFIHSFRKVTGYTPTKYAKKFDV